MTLRSIGRQKLAILASVFLFAGFLFGWVGVADLKNRHTDTEKDIVLIDSINPQQSKNTGGEGRLLLTRSGTVSLYAVNANPTDGPSEYDIVSPSGFPQHSVNFPSVAQNGIIAYGYRKPGEQQTVWAMDADGSNVRQLTFYDGSAGGDDWPVISPDGTKVAFLSRRFGQLTYPDGTLKESQVFIVNTDGTGLHQATLEGQPSVVGPGIPPGTVGGIGSRANAVGWNGSQLVVDGAVITAGTLPSDPPLVRRTGIYIAGQNSVARAQSASAVVFDVFGGMILYQDSGSPTLFVLPIGEGDPIHILEAGDLGIAGGQSRGGARFSPDGSKIVYGALEENGCVRTIDLDGSNRVTVINNRGNEGNGKWWIPGPPIPSPNRLRLEPGTLRLQNDGVTTQQVTPTLYDANNNVIFHAAEYGFICDVTHPCSVNPNIFVYTPDGRIRTNGLGVPSGYASFCGTSGGITGCSIVSVGMDVNFAEILASVPSANTNGAGGPAVFTVRRESTAPNSAFNVDFTVGGTAVRDVDYSLNVTGNTIIFPVGQTTYDLRVTPLQAAGNKTVIMSIAAPPGSNYITTPGRDTASVNIIDNGAASTILSLSTITPASGGNGGVVVSTINGSNIASGATVKLTRSGQPDIPGANVNVRAGGKSLTSIFDLNGIAPGQWNVVVTNPNNSVAQITNGFMVEASTPTRLTVQVSGANTIRASHTRSRYDVVYTNHGNSDAFGVIVFITGVAPNECADENDADCTFLETPLSNIPDIPGQDPFPAWVRQVPNIVPVDLPNVIGPGFRQVGAIPVLIPRIPANSSGTFRFSMRFTSVSQSGLQRINAAILPPMVTAVTVAGAVKPTVGMRATTPEDANSDMNCIDSIFLNAISCAVGFLPGNACVGAGIGTIQNVAQLAAGISVQGDAAITPMSGAQIYAAGLSVMTCLKSATPIGQLLNIIGCMAGIYDSCATCLGPDACNPFSIFFVQSADPNEKTGVRRLTTQNYIPKSNLLYGISFENRPDATAPAQDVVITDQLDTSKLDVTTFELGQITFGDTVINVPSGLKTYSTEVDLRPANDLLVSVNANLDQNTGLVTWTFLSLDPFTRQTPTNALAGFLPPNILGTEGAGKVLFTISPKSAVTTGDEIRNRATIVFDLNAPIDTNEWLNTIDESSPASQVIALAPTQSNSTFPVNWSGADTDSGIANYSIYVSDNGGPFNLWLYNSIPTTANFTGQIGHTYGFYSVAQDNASNLEAAPAVADTTTIVLGPTAAGVSISGRVLDSGQGIGRARLTLTSSDGQLRHATTNPFGYYKFEDVEAGRTYVLTVRHKKYVFANPSRLISLVDDLTDVDFEASH